MNEKIHELGCKWVKGVLHTRTRDLPQPIRDENRRISQSDRARSFKHDSCTDSLPQRVYECTLIWLCAVYRVEVCIHVLYIYLDGFNIA